MIAASITEVLISYYMLHGWILAEKISDDLFLLLGLRFLQWRQPTDVNRHQIRNEREKDETLRRNFQNLNSFSHLC